jgi:hypothetical protein
MIFLEITEVLISVIPNGIQLFNPIELRPYYAVVIDIQGSI